MFQQNFIELLRMRRIGTQALGLVARPLLCHGLDNLVPGAVTHQQQVEDTGEVREQYSSENI